MAICHPWSWIGLLLLLTSATLATAVRVANPDLGALLDLKKATDSSNRLKSWVAAADCSKWDGVACDPQGRVFSLTLENHSLTGRLPASFGNLTKLAYAFLNSNKLQGPLPSTLTKLTSLDILSLNNNKLEGKIPPFLGKLKQLRVLRLSSNKFVGAIPPCFNNLKNLDSLSLSSNRLTGFIPNFLGNLVKLDSLSLGNNLFHGGIPASLLKLTYLQTLDLSKNKLTGGVPAGLINLSGLVELSLGSNAFNGTIPASLGNFVGLSTLDLSNNKLSGIIPPTFAKLETTLVRLNNNELSGPMVVPFVPSFSQLDASNTFLSGPLTLPDEIKESCKRGDTVNLSNTCLRLTRSALGSCCLKCKYKTDAVCNAFCNALQPGGACAGHGLCVLRNGKRTCVCNKGYKAASPFKCVKA